MLRSIGTALSGLLLIPSANAQCVTTFPSNEAFTSFTVGTPGTLANNWTNITTGDDLDWWVDNNGTPTLLTGPIGDHTVNATSGNYMYLEATGASNSPNKSAILQSPCYNISSLSSPYLTFWYQLDGTQQGSLYVDINANGTITTNHWSITGNQ